MKRVKKVLWGFVFLVIGVLLVLNAFEILQGNVLFDGWWTLLLMVPCAVALLTESDRSWPAVGFLTGLILLMIRQEVLSGSVLMKLLVPAAVILLGIRMILRYSAVRNDNGACRKSYLAGKNLEEVCTIFRHTSVTCNAPTFKGVEATAAFGRLRLDLSDKTIENEAVIRANSIFGTVEILLPGNVQVVSDSSNFFGKMARSVNTSDGGEKPVVYVYGNASFGRVHIRQTAD